MTTILKGYQFRLYPSDEQKKLINQTIGCSRFIYNHFLEERINEYKKTGRTLTCYEQIKEIPQLCKDYPWLKEVDSCSLRAAVFNLENAYHRFFSQNNGFPKFKNKDTGNSYKTNNIKNTYKGESIRVDLKNRTITLPVLKEIYHIGNIKSAVIRRAGFKYYVSVLVEEPLIEQPFQPRSIVGLDLGIKDLIITNHNEKIENNLECANINKRMKGLQKALARCQKGSKSREKIKLKIKRAYMKL